MKAPTDTFEAVGVLPAAIGCVAGPEVKKLILASVLRMDYIAVSRYFGRDINIEISNGKYVLFVSIAQF